MAKQLPLVNVGVDVSKDTLDVYLLERDLLLSIPNTEQPIASLIKRLARYRLERIVIEATGRLEHAFVSAAIARELPIVVVSPLKVRRFAEAVGQLAKTDQIDARLIAQFAATLKPTPYAPCDTKAQIIKRGLELGVDYSLTTSCYDPLPGPLACGRCDSCLLRKKGFAENGKTDPIAYVAQV